MEQCIERDCTSKCKSSTHAKQILTCVPFATTSQLRTYAVWLCHNFAAVSDNFGRHLLHLAAACGKWETVEWLLKQCNAEIDIKDRESGWSALHRSFFYGQLACARILCMNGASLKLIDHEGFTPLDIIVKDRLPYIEYQHSDPSDVYAWGSNFNYNLGVGNSQCKVIPDVLEVFRKDFIDIKQVEICKFHSVFLSTNGLVYTCGYGHGGRLGQETEDISLVPSLVKGLGNQLVMQVAAGQDHLVLLLENRQVWSCGLNVYHQLGHIPPPERLLAPKALSLKFLKGKAVIGICAARFHSVIYTKDSVFTFGLNAGQLGHPKGDRTQIHPRQVSALYTEECHLTHVATSDGAIVCATSRGDVYVLHEYQIRKIASRQLEILKLSVVGGHLDSRCDVAGVREGGGLELRVALLTKSGKVFLWRQTDPYLRRCLFTSLKELIISDIHINHYSIGMITSDNEGYIGTISNFKGKRSAPPTNICNPTLFNIKTSKGLTVLLDTDDCHFIKAKKLPNIYRGTSITSDSKGRNFAVLQSNAKMGLVEIPMISNSKIQQDFTRLYLETHELDDFHDIIINVDKRKFAAHKFILASRSEFFKKQFCKENFSDGELVIDNMKHEAFEQILKFMYTNHCDFLVNGYEVKWGNFKENGKKNKSNAKNKASNPVHIVQEACKKLGLTRLSKRLEGVKLVNGKISVNEPRTMPRLTFSRLSLSNLCDVNLISSVNEASSSDKKTVFSCHKCILAARLDYFHSMLSHCWEESSRLNNLKLPIPSRILEVLINYLYSDDAGEISDSDDVEFLCHILMTSDQLLIPHLKEICEFSLVKLLVSDEVMEELSAYYRNLVPCMYNRRISMNRNGVENDLELLEKEFPVSDASVFDKSRSDSHDGKSKTRRRCASWRSDSKDMSSVIENDVKSLDNNIVLDILIPDIIENTVMSTSPIVKQSTVTKIINKQEAPKPGQWVMRCPTEEQVLSLDQIMLKEKRGLTPLQKKTNFPDKKPLPHLSQKQKKMMKANKVPFSSEISIPNSPTSTNWCPWGKLPEQSPPSPSFWDILAKKELQPSSSSKENSTPVKSFSTAEQKKSNLRDNSPVVENSQDIVISLHDIQLAEEQKLRRAAQPTIKPLHILNIEDQAIEEPWHCTMLTIIIKKNYCI
ncbi:inhibitor of Bruton tyrosine kinase [Caerostris extrusa]|uniref:Inhibitor of Bruton tyrosine kinase n=1 Tax=Caerostris extrusa TaxID=172846 RepID=A0AAV4QR57_CAEEX|nr:inhibitor of Bruton tyrosine kinase [Caerostris extrusa]